MGDWIALIIGVGSSVVPIVIAIIVGGALERKHLKSLDEREETFGFVELSTFKRPPAGYPVAGSALCHGAVVMAPSIWKVFLASWRNFFGGEMRSIATDLERGRREALVRLRRHAAAQGCDMVVNLRFDTGRVELMGGGRSRGTYPTIEVFAFGTGLRRAKAKPAPAVL